MVIGGYRVGSLLRATGKGIIDNDLLGLAAETAYYFLFSLFPLLLFAAALLSLAGNGQQTVHWLVDRFARVVPADAFALVRGIVRDVVLSKNAPGLLSVGALLALWSGSNVFGSMRDVLNRAYGIPETRPWWKQQIMALAGSLITGIVVGLASTALLAGPQIASAMGGVLGLGAAAVAVWNVVQYVVAFALIIAVFFLAYHFLPNLTQPSRQVIVGSIFAAVLWLVVTFFFRLYVQHFGTYNATYGTIGGVIVLLTWMYLTMLVLLIGGEFNAKLHQGAGAARPRRGAVYAGRVVTSAGPPRASTDRIAPSPLRARAAEDDARAAGNPEQRGGAAVPHGDLHQSS